MAGEFNIDQVLPWGRNRAEYSAFFDLGAVDRKTSILDCAAGPSSFNAEMTEHGYSVISADPIYQFTADAIAARVAAARTVMMVGLRAAPHRFVLTGFGTPERVEEVRLAAVRRFLEDFADGQAPDRYLAASLPHLPLADDRFDMVLCSHFLFLYSHQLDIGFHRAAIAEMLRVGREVRIFPLLDIDGETSRHLAPLCAMLEKSGQVVEIRRVDYEFQKGGHSMLRISPR